MSLPGKDLKQTIPAEIHAVIKAYAEAFSMEQREVVIQVLGDWADKQVHRVTVMHHALTVAEVIPEERRPRTTVRLAGEAG
jgi:hypothetical protein